MISPSVIGSSVHSQLILGIAWALRTSIIRGAIEVFLVSMLHLQWLLMKVIRRSIETESNSVHQWALHPVVGKLRQGSLVWLHQWVSGCRVLIVKTQLGESTNRERPKLSVVNSIIDTLRAPAAGVFTSLLLFEMGMWTYGIISLFGGYTAYILANTGNSQ